MNPLIRAIICLLLAASIPAVVRADTRLTDSEAVAAASAFCSRIGDPVTAPGSAHFPAVDPPKTLPRYWQERWLVTFPGQATVEVADATGVVTHFADFRLVNSSGNWRLKDKHISRDSAVTRAARALRDTGQSADYTPAASYLLPGRDYIGSKRAIWLIVWDRRYRGNITYENHRASVELAADSGQVAVVDVNFPTPPPAGLAVSYSRRDADNEAHNIMIHIGLPHAKLIHSGAEVVTPNEYWTTGDGTPTVKPGRAAYTYRYVAERRLYDIWVDTESGQLDGGGVIGPLGPH